MPVGSVKNAQPAQRASCAMQAASAVRSPLATELSAVQPASAASLLPVAVGWPTTATTVIPTEDTVYPEQAALTAEAAGSADTKEKPHQEVPAQEGARGCRACAQEADAVHPLSLPTPKSPSKGWVSPAVVSQPRTRRFALMIGNSQYDAKLVGRYGDLPAAVKFDVLRMREELCYRGFEVEQLGFDLNAAGILKRLAIFVQAFERRCEESSGVECDGNIQPVEEV